MIGVSFLNPPKLFEDGPAPGISGEIRHGKYTCPSPVFRQRDLTAVDSNDLSA
jgi:hypothetical protein